MKQRAPRNKTLVLSDEERARYARQLLRMEQPRPQEEILDRLILGDTLQVINLLPDHFAQLIVIDPPYNLTKNFNGTQFNQCSDEKYLEYLRSWFPQVCRKLTPTGSLYLCGDWRTSAVLYTVMKENLEIQNRITWQREKGRGCKANWKNCMEDIWYGVADSHNYTYNLENVKVKRRVIAPYREKGKPKDWREENGQKFRITHPSNFWDDISVPFWSMPENTDHPTQKPEKLIAKLVLASSSPGDIVFDPFVGSGTTAVVARKLGRHFCGIDCNEEYLCWGMKRLEKAVEDNHIQGYFDGVFWERNTMACR